MKKNGKKKKKHISHFFPFFILIATLFMGIGYASINNILLDITGSATALVQDGIFITDVGLNEEQTSTCIDTTLNSSVAVGTILKSNVTLCNERTSQISYDISVFNNNNEAVMLTDIISEIGLPDVTYNNNSDIIYTISGININDKINAKKEKTFTITFRYNDSVINEIEQITNNILKSYINFNFEQMFVVQYYANGGVFENNTDNKIIYYNENNIELKNEDIPTRDSFQFKGWALAQYATEAEYNIGDSIDISNINKLYAIWGESATIVTNQSEFNIAASSGKDFIVEGGTYTYMEMGSSGVNVTINNAKCNNYLSVTSNSNVIINEFDGTNSNTSPFISIESRATVTINNATIKGNGSIIDIGRVATLIINGGNYTRSTLVNSGYANSVLEINGGTFTSVTSIKKLVGSVGNVTITGGTFGFDPSSSGYIANGCTVIDNGNSTWTVMQS